MYLRLVFWLACQRTIMYFDVWTDCQDGLELLIKLGNMPSILGWIPGWCGEHDSRIRSDRGRGAQSTYGCR